MDTYDIGPILKLYISKLPSDRNQKEKQFAEADNELLRSFKQYESIWKENFQECIAGGFQLRHIIFSENFPILFNAKPNKCHYIYGESRTTSSQKPLSQRDEKWREIYRKSGILIVDLLPFNIIRDEIPDYEKLMVVSLPYIEDKLNFIRSKLGSIVQKAECKFIYPITLNTLKKAASDAELRRVFGFSLDPHDAFTSNISGLRGRITSYMKSIHDTVYCGFHDSILHRKHTE